MSAQAVSLQARSGAPHHVAPRTVSDSATQTDLRIMSHVGAQTDSPIMMHGATQTDSAVMTHGATQTDSAVMTHGATQTDSAVMMHGAAQTDSASVTPAAVQTDSPATMEKGVQTNGTFLDSVFLAVDELERMASESRTAVELFFERAKAAVAESKLLDGRDGASQASATTEPDVPSEERKEMAASTHQPTEWNASDGQSDEVQADTKAMGEGETPIEEVVLDPRDGPQKDGTCYGEKAHDSITDPDEGSKERAVVTRHQMELNGSLHSYTATVGHLVTRDRESKPNAKIFYVAYTRDEPGRAKRRPVTFFYGGHGASSMYLMLGSFGPCRIEDSGVTSNPHTLLDRSDLVFVNPVGTGYSTAIWPWKNKDFWGVEPDARSVAQFVERYLRMNEREGAPTFLIGDGYGAERSVAATMMLYRERRERVKQIGLVLLSPRLDHGGASHAVNLFPTLVAISKYGDKARPGLDLKDLDTLMERAMDFATHRLAPLQDKSSQRLRLTPDVETEMTRDFGVSLHETAGNAKVQPAIAGIFRAAIDGHEVNSPYANELSKSADYDAYVDAWCRYVSTDLKYQPVSEFIGVNEEMARFWDFGYSDIQDRRYDNANLFWGNDLAGVMDLNGGLHLFVATGYFDREAPFFHAKRTLDELPLRPGRSTNITRMRYPAGHMLYQDEVSRGEMRKDLTSFYDAAERSHSQLFSTPVNRGPAKIPLLINTSLANQGAHSDSAQFTGMTLVESPAGDKLTDSPTGSAELLTPHGKFENGSGAWREPWGADNFVSTGG
jgi:carboxypeptidase C (cathepsin A)